MNQNDKEEGASDEEWPDSLAAMVAASEHHEVLLENERVRVLDSGHQAGRNRSGSHASLGECALHSWHERFHSLRPRGKCGLRFRYCSL